MGLVKRLSFILVVVALTGIAAPATAQQAAKPPLSTKKLDALFSMTAYWPFKLGTTA
jgi:hypothetical protein